MAPISIATVARILIRKQNQNWKPEDILTRLKNKPRSYTNISREAFRVIYSECWAY